MKRAAAEEIFNDQEKYFNHDRVFLNNPVVMQGMGLAPLVVLAASGKNALMLAVAVALLLTPTRALACLLSRVCPLSAEPSPAELRSKLLIRGLIYCVSAALVYIPAYAVLNAIFDVELLTLGIYLPILAVEPMLIYRYGRVQESLRKAVSKGLRITVGYALLLLLLGCLREVLAYGTLFGMGVLSRSILPLAAMPAGGFIVLGVLCAVWRMLAQRSRNYLLKEAHGLMALYQQEEAHPEQ